MQLLLYLDRPIAYLQDANPQTCSTSGPEHTGLRSPNTSAPCSSCRPLFLEVRPGPEPGAGKARAAAGAHQAGATACASTCGSCARATRQGRRATSWRKPQHLPSGARFQTLWHPRAGAPWCCGRGRMGLGMGGNRAIFYWTPKLAAGFWFPSLCYVCLQSPSGFQAVVDALQRQLWCNTGIHSCSCGHYMVVCPTDSEAFSNSQRAIARI